MYKDKEKVSEGAVNVERRGEGQQTIVATANAAAVDHGFPCEEVALVNGTETFNAFLVCGFGAPCVELFDQPLGCASGRGHMGCLAGEEEEGRVAGMCSTEGLRLSWTRNIWVRPRL